MSSSTITPLSILCCGPLGSLRYYKATISGIGGSCPGCTSDCSCTNLNGDYYFDFLDDVNPLPCVGYLAIAPATCGYAFLTFAIGLCEGSPKRLTYTITMSGTSNGTEPATYIRWKKIQVESSMDPHVLSFDDQLGSECSAGSSTITVVPLPPEDMIAIQDPCFPRRPSTVPPNYGPRLSSPMESAFPSCGTCGGSSGAANRYGVPGARLQSGSCGGGGNCSISYNIENGNIMLELSPPGGDAITPIPNFTINTTHEEASSVFGRRLSSILTKSVEAGGAMPDAASCTDCDGRIDCHTCKLSGPGDYVPPPDSTNLLTLNADGTFTEKTLEGLRFDYTTAGVLSRIMNASQARWTVVGSPNYVIDPASRRTTFSYDSMTGYLRRYQDPFGRITTVTHDAGGSLTQFVSPELCTTNLSYDVNGRLKTVTSAEGVTTSFTYSSAGMCTKIEKPDGGVFEYEYADWLNTQITAPNMQVTNVRHAVSRQVTCIIDPSGARTSFSYQARRQLESQSPNNSRSTQIYAALPNGIMGLVSIVEPSGRQTFLYDTNSKVKAEIDARSNRTSYVWNGTGLLQAEVNALNGRTTFVYSASNQRAATIDPLNHRTSYVYDFANNLIAEINPLARRTTRTYQNGQTRSVRSPVGAITTMVYDLNNRRRAQVDPLGNRTTFIFESCSNPTTIIQPSGTRTTNIYRYGQLAATVNPLGNRTSFIYNLSGLPVRTQSPMGRISTTIYDAMERPKARIDPSGLRTTTLYDSSGRAITSISPDGVRTTTIYNNCCNRPMASVAANGSRTSYAYDAVGNRIRTQQPTGAIHTVVYDALNRERRQIDSFARLTTTIYDQAGRTTANINALNQRTTTLYDAANQPTGSISPLGHRTTQVYDWQVAP